MPIDILYPKVSLETNTGRISRWLVENGAAVTSGQVLFEIDDDKATVEVDAPIAGTIHFAPAMADADEVSVGSCVAQIFAQGEPPAASPSATPSAAAPPGPSSAPSPAARSDKATAVASPSSTAARIIATPLARRMAAQSNLDLATISGSGPHGRIQRKDVAGSVNGSAAPARMAHNNSDTLSAASSGLLKAVWLNRAETRPVVFLHGYASDHNSWRGLFAGNGWTQASLALDLPGHGGSPLSVPADLDGVCVCVEATLEAAGVESPVLVGHSFGAAVAARLMSRGYVGARALCLVSPAGLGAEINAAFLSGFLRARQKNSLMPWLQELVHDPAVISPALVKAVEEQRRNESLTEAMGAFSDIFFADGVQTFSIRDDLAKARIPTRVIFGRQDRIIPFSHTRDLPDAVGLHGFANCGHMPYAEKPGETLRILDELAMLANSK